MFTLMFICIIVLIILFMIVCGELVKCVPPNDFHALLKLIIGTWITIIMIFVIASIGISVKGNILTDILLKSSNITIIEKDDKVTDFSFTYNGQEYHFAIEDR